MHALKGKCNRSIGLFIACGIMKLICILVSYKLTVNVLTFNFRRVGLMQNLVLTCRQLELTNSGSLYSYSVGYILSAHVIHNVLHVVHLSNLLRRLR